MLLPRRLANAILVTVSIVWVINFGAQFVVPDYHSDVSINGIFIAVVGGAFALSRKGGDDDEDGDDDGDPPPRPVMPPPRRDPPRRDHQRRTPDPYRGPNGRDRRDDRGGYSDDRWPPPRPRHRSNDPEGDPWPRNGTSDGQGLAPAASESSAERSLASSSC